MSRTVHLAQHYRLPAWVGCSPSWEALFVEVKIGVLHTAREITFDSTDSAGDITKAVQKALADGAVLNLNDDRGRTILIPADRIAYVELGDSASRRVGFGSTS